MTRHLRVPCCHSRACTGFAILGSALVNSTMMASVMRNGRLEVDRLPLPRLQHGEVMVRTLACGICGSDLHALHHGPELVDALDRAGSPIRFDPSRDVVMGHEFCGEIVDFGPGVERRLAAGARVCSVPFLVRGNRFNHIGFSNDAPGGYGEYMAVSEDTLLEVPNGLSSSEAAMTEPFAVAAHAVAKARLEPGDVPLVVGCGAVGLAVIAMLKRRGAGPIVAADLSPARRQLAERMGADYVVDPNTQSPYTAWAEAAIWRDAASAPAVPPWETGPARHPAVAFECVGIPGMIQRIMAGVPSAARIIIVGVCMQRDQLEPIFGIAKELELRFVWGYSPDEYAETLRAISEGELLVQPVLTGATGVGGVTDAFDRLSGGGEDIKIIVEPWRT